MAGNKAAEAEVHIALLRGINVGGKNKLPMRQLVSIFAAAGCRDVRTYIQSGNVVYSAEAQLASRIPAEIKKQVAAQCGFEVPVVTRTAEELAEVVASNPYAKPDVDGKALHVAFLADRPSATEVTALDPDRSPPDEFAVVGREIYLRCPNGLARTKLTNAYFDSRLATTSTVRNWRTTLKLLEMASG